MSSPAGWSPPTILRGWVCTGEKRLDSRYLERHSISPAPVYYCLAGGGCSTWYFNLDIEGQHQYNMAEYFAQRGAVVVAIDHPGVGLSVPGPDLFQVTPSILASCHAEALSQLESRLETGKAVAHLPPIERFALVGLGHSMGAMLGSVIQGLHAAFDLLVLLGDSAAGLPEVLDDEERALSGLDLKTIEPELVRLARTRWSARSSSLRRAPSRGEFFTEDVPAEVRRAFSQPSVPLLPVCGLASMIPNATRAEKANIDVPTFFGFGDSDFTDDYLGTVASYRSITDAALFVLPGSGHCHNQAISRHILWDRILGWVEGVSRMPGRAGSIANPSSNSDVKNGRAKVAPVMDNSDADVSEELSGGGADGPF